MIVKDRQDGDSSLGDALYFYKNAEGTALSPFDSWLVLRGIKTMALRVYKQQENAVKIAEWLKACPFVTEVLVIMIILSIHKYTITTTVLTIIISTHNIQ